MRLAIGRLTIIRCMISSHSDAARVCVSGVHMREATGTDAGQTIFGKADRLELPSLTALVQPAKLCCDGREMPCVVLDLVDRLLKVETFSEIPAHRTLHFELAGGDQFEVVLSWQDDGLAGLLVIGKVREGVVPSNGVGQMAVRRVRLIIGAEARLQVGDSSCLVRLINISQQGAGMVCPDTLISRALVRLDLPNLMPIAATVQWGDHPRYGLAFSQVLTLEELAAVSSQFHRRSDKPRLQLYKTDLQMDLDA